MTRSKLVLGWEGIAEYKSLCMAKLRVHLPPPRTDARFTAIKAYESDSSRGALSVAAMATCATLFRVGTCRWRRDESLCVLAGARRHGTGDDGRAGPGQPCPPRA